MTFQLGYFYLMLTTILGGKCHHYLELGARKLSIESASMEIKGASSNTQEEFEIGHDYSLGFVAAA